MAPGDNHMTRGILRDPQDIVTAFIFYPNTALLSYACSGRSAGDVIHKICKKRVPVNVINHPAERA